MRLLGFSVGYSEAALHDRPLLARQPPDRRWSFPGIDTSFRSSRIQGSGENHDMVRLENDV